MTMNTKRIFTVAAIGMALIGSTFADTIVIKEPEVRTIVTEAGFADPILIVREGEYWRVRSPNGEGEKEVTLFVNANGEVLGAAEVTESRIATKETTTTTTTTTTTQQNHPVTQEDEVTEIVLDAGFHNVHDIDFLDRKGVWKAEADDITGEDFALHIDPLTGLIIHIEDD